MAVYLPMMAMCLGLAWIVQHGRPRRLAEAMWVLVVLPPAVVAAMRYEIGSDWRMYYNIFASILREGTVDTGKSLESGFLMVVRICGLIVPEPVFVFAVYAFLIIGFYCEGCRKCSKDVFLSLLLFFATGTYYDAFNGIRQYAAAAICFYAVRWILSGEFPKYAAAVLLAGMMHYSAWIMLPVYLVRKVHFTAGRAGWMTAAATVGGKAAYRLVSLLLQYTRYRYFLTSEEYEVMPTEASTVYIGVISAAALLLAVRGRFLPAGRRRFPPAGCGRRRTEPPGRCEIMLNLQFLTFAVVLLSWSVPLVWRVEYYFLPLEMLIVPELLTLIPRRPQRQCAGALITVMYAVIELYGILAKGWYECIPYRVWWGRLG